MNLLEAYAMKNGCPFPIKRGISWLSPVISGISLKLQMLLSGFTYSVVTIETLTIDNARTRSKGGEDGE